jgi:pterin-4a-carbinolamine dehydratase
LRLDVLTVNFQLFSIHAASQCRLLRLRYPRASYSSGLRAPHRIERTFRFRDFREALTFVQKIGELAESESHHPDVSFGGSYAAVSLRTNKIKGLHENDFNMAAKVDRLAQPPNG